MRTSRRADSIPGWNPVSSRQQEAIGPLVLFRRELTGTASELRLDGRREAPPVKGQRALANPLFTEDGPGKAVLRG